MDRNGNLDARGKPRVQTFCLDDSLTVQSDAEAADINVILRKHSLGILDHMRDVEARYLDVSEFTDFADAYRQAETAKVEFMKLHPKVRAVFENDVHKWLDAAHDPEKIQTVYRPGLEALGLLEPVEDVAEAPAAPVPPEGP